MSFPLIGEIGKVPKKEPIIHISKPAPPTAIYPPRKIKKKNPAKPKLIKISDAATNAPKCSVNFFDWFTLRVGEENGTLNAKVVKRKRRRPKGQILCSLQTPLLRKYAIEKNFWTKPTRMLVAKKTGNISQIWLRVITLTYEKEIARTIIAVMYAAASDFVGINTEPFFSPASSFRLVSNDFF